ncbi:hypothetical protein [Quadrisphaera granulorum]|uniref:hypothetical protein n=1 Tax=Quadrisphaera granulorum TaxID=317664 RepID=UPI000D6CA43B|nr:hypothetical protein [Quadrisphaera granulorum]
MQAPTPGGTALLDQQAAAIGDIDLYWRWNGWFEADERIEASMLKIVGQSPDDLVDGDGRGLVGGPQGLGQGYLWWSGAAWRLPPWTARTTYGRALQRFAKQTAPPLDRAVCDRCAEPGCWGAFVVAFSPHLVGLTLCGDCTYEFIWASPSKYLGEPHWAASIFVN